MSGARNRVIHLGDDGTGSACGAWLGGGARRAGDGPPVDCPGCLQAMRRCDDRTAPGGETCSDPDCPVCLLFACPERDDRERRRSLAVLRASMRTRGAL